MSRHRHFASASPDSPSMSPSLLQATPMVSYTKVSINGESFSIHHKNERIFNILGRKGHVTPLKSADRVDSNVTNPGQLSNVKEREAIAIEVLTKTRSDHEVNESEDGAYRYLDENGIPELVREKLVGNESTQPFNEI
ncbi:hypothetical protein L1887_17658 [Cichorium endivia]|nr:hypothetical protein L1887_17658 [Cichorium endivia]